ncbi:AGAP006053-PA, partial [Anopheles gambiae str. PEST]
RAVREQRRHSAWLEVVIPKIFWQEQELLLPAQKRFPKSRKTLLWGRSSVSATTTTDNPCSTHNRNIWCATLGYFDHTNTLTNDSTLGLYAHLSGRIASHGYPLSQERFALATVHRGTAEASRLRVSVLKRLTRLLRPLVPGSPLGSADDRYGVAVLSCGWLAASDPPLIRSVSVCCRWC